MKVVLAQKWAVGGVMYGPGTVEVTEAVHATLARRGALDHPLTAYPMLIAAGFTTMEDVAAASDEALLKIEGVGPALLKKIRGIPEAPEPPKPRFIGEHVSAAEQ